MSSSLLDLCASEACLDVSKCGLSWSSGEFQQHKPQHDAVLPGGQAFRVSQYLAHFSQSFIFQDLQAAALISKDLKRWKNTYFRKTNKKLQGPKTYSLASTSYTKNLGKSRRLYFPACCPVTLEFDSEASEEAGILPILQLLLKHVENLLILMWLRTPCTSSSPVTFVKRPVEFIS